MCTNSDKPDYILENDRIVLRLWGKSSPYHPLVCHMIDVGCMMEALLIDSVFSHITIQLSDIFDIKVEELVVQIILIASLHDIGKCHPLFQQKQMAIQIVQELDRAEKLQPGDTRVYRHEEFALIWLRDFLKQKLGWDLSVALLAGQVVACHHQHNKGTNPHNCIDKKDWWNQLQSCLAEMLHNLISPINTSVKSCAHYDIAGTLLLSMIVLADWIASNSDFFPPTDQIEGDEVYLKTSRHYAKRAITLLGFNRTTIFEEVPLSFSSVWPSIKPENMRSLQSTCESLIQSGEIPPGLLVIEAPMGEGKTETALYTALQWMRMASLNGLYMALPTAATSNQMYERVQKLLENLGYTNKIKLLHGMAWLLDDMTPIGELKLTDEDNEIASDWFRPAKRGLLAPWAVGTVDQAMMAALKVRYGVLRWAGLSGKVLILDEVHAYDAYMVSIIERLLTWCSVLNIPVILLSATLPAELRRKLILAYTGKQSADTKDELVLAYPLITHTKPQGEIKYFAVPEVHIRRQVKISLFPLLGQWEKVAAEAVSMIKDGGCLCIVVNTVKDAQQLYCEVKKLADNDLDSMLFHARFKSGRRQEIEQDCLNSFGKKSLLDRDDPEYKKRPLKSILIATQVVEQSLDLDFDIMISAIAPIDLLLQRLGRLHRHDGRKRIQGLHEPKLYILIPENEKGFGSTEMVYEPWILHQTNNVLQGKKVINIPEEIRELIEIVYSLQEPEKNHPFYPDWVGMIKNMEKERDEAKLYLIPAPDSRRFWMMRKDTETFDEDEEGGKWFSAKTRLGNDSRKFILLDESNTSKIEKNMKNLSHSEGREILKNSVSLRSYIINGSVSGEGFAGPIKGKGLLSGHLILLLRDGVYRFILDQKYNYQVIDDHELGILVERVE